MEFYLDSVNITADINKVCPVPVNSGGIYPDAASKWFDLLAIISNHPELRDTFFNVGGVHVLRVEDKLGAGVAYNAKILLRATYAARNS